MGFARGSRAKFDAPIFVLPSIIWIYRSIPSPLTEHPLAAQVAAADGARRSPPAEHSWLWFACAEPSASAQAAATSATIAPSLLPDRLGARAALTFTIGYAGGDAGVPSPVRRSVILTFSLTIGASGHPRSRDANAIRVPHSCPLGGLPFAAEFAYADGSSGSALATTPCPIPRARTARTLATTPCSSPFPSAGG
jgi:hypothetical protein